MEETFVDVSMFGSPDMFASYMTYPKTFVVFEKIIETRVKSTQLDMMLPLGNIELTLHIFLVLFLHLRFVSFLSYAGLPYTSKRQATS